jgi:hypothetical protein
VVTSSFVIRWRRWLSARYIGLWLGESAHYPMALAGTPADNPVGGEILVKRRSASETDHGGVAAKHDDPARQKPLRMRRHIARAC